MDLLARARTLAACPLFAGLEPAVVIRLAERARPEELEAGERRTTDENVWVVGSGSLVIVSRAAVSPEVSVNTKRRHGGTATAGHVLGLIRVVAPQTPAVEAIAERASSVVGLTLDDLRDVLEEDPLALAALSEALARVLLQGARGRLEDR